jgi:hypothetical protein
MILSASLMKKPNRDDSSQSGLTNLLNQLQQEVRLSTRRVTKSIEILKGAQQATDTNELRSILSPTLRPTVKARGLPLFDRAIHLVTNFDPLVLYF